MDENFDLNSYLEKMPFDFLTGRSHLMLSAYRAGLQSSQVDEIDRKSIIGSIKTTSTYGEWFVVFLYPGLTIEKLDKMTHAIGYMRSKVDLGIFVPVRNFYAVREDDPEWEELVIDGFATKSKSIFNESLYRLTDKAFDTLSRALFVTIKQ